MHGNGLLINRRNAAEFLAEFRALGLEAVPVSVNAREVALYVRRPGGQWRTPTDREQANVLPFARLRARGFAGGDL